MQRERERERKRVRKQKVWKMYCHHNMVGNNNAVVINIKCGEVKVYG